MATKEQIEFIAGELFKARPENLMKILNDFNAGVGFVLKLLYAAEENRLSAGEISDAMRVSTPRVTALLKKMENRDLIVSESDKTDARVRIVRLSEKGKITAEEMRGRVMDHISDVIDKLGIEKMEQFIALSIEVNAAMDEKFSSQT